ncbi:6-phosphogluconolactonase [Thermoproteota archaeon]
MVERDVVSIIYNEKEEELYKAAANTIKNSIQDLLEKKEYVVFAIAGGRSVPYVFTLLKEKDIPWDKVHIFMVDDRMIPIDEEGSNFKLANDTFIKELVDKGKMPEANVHPYIYLKDDPDHGVPEYDEELKKYGGKFDIALISAGEDGHIGDLNPNHHSVENESEMYIMMHDSPKPQKDRMTMSKKLLLKTEVVLLLFIGEEKKESFKKFIDQNISYKECPAKLVQRIMDSYTLTNIKA